MWIVKEHHLTIDRLINLVVKEHHLTIHRLIELVVNKHHLTTDTLDEGHLVCRKRTSPHYRYTYLDGNQGTSPQY